MFFFDEGRFGLQSTISSIWAEKGKPIEVKVKQGYKSFYIYSSVSPSTGETFSLFLPEVNTEMMNIYLEEFTKAYPEKKIMLIMDRASWHRYKALEKFENITIKFLPAYSPQLNPVEKLWWWLRKEITHNVIFETIDQMMDKLEKEFLKLDTNITSSLCNCSYL